MQEAKIIFKQCRVYSELKYSLFPGCTFECSLNLTLNKLDCLPWYYPKPSSHVNEDIDICDGAATKQFQDVFSNFINDEETHCSHCVADCQAVTFSIEQSSVLFPEDVCMVIILIINYYKVELNINFRYRKV